MQIAIKKEGEKPHWISLDDFKKLLFEEEVSTKGMPLPYSQKVEAFFDKVIRTSTILTIWEEAYPNVDIEAELKLAKAWLLSNTNNAKKDFKKFCNNWLARAMRNPSKVAQTTKDRHQKSNEELYRKKKQWNKEKPASQEQIKEILKEYNERKI